MGKTTAKFHSHFKDLCAVTVYNVLKNLPVYSAMFVFVKNVTFFDILYMGLMNVSHVDGFLYKGE